MSIRSHENFRGAESAEYECTFNLVLGPFLNAPKKFG